MGRSPRTPRTPGSEKSGSLRRILDQRRSLVLQLFQEQGGFYPSSEYRPGLAGPESEIRAGTGDDWKGEVVVRSLVSSIFCVPCIPYLHILEKLIKRNVGYSLLFNLTLLLNTNFHSIN